MALPWLFEFWAHDHQLPPEAGDGAAWKTWVILGGRGSGKTRAGAEWVRAQVEGARPLDPGRARRIALVGETLDQVREVMVMGESGILASSPADRRPEWEAGRRRLVWPNGATAQCFSAHDPDGLRGPQFDGAWADEFGCPAVDKGTNAPNRFVDPKSSESVLPDYSSGRRDDLIQMQYLRSVTDYWADPANNPVSDIYGGRMVDTARMHVWAWDSRPYPEFPANSGLWADAANYGRGHWISGRTTAQPLASVVAEICARAGVPDPDVSWLYGLVRGYAVGEVTTARAALQPLMLAFGFDAAEREGRLSFRMRGLARPVPVTPDDLAIADEAPGPFERQRAGEGQGEGRVRLTYVEAEGSYETRTAEAVHPDAVSPAVAQSEMALALLRQEGLAIAERWLTESRIARDTLRFALPPSRAAIGAGDVVEAEGALYRVDRVEDAGARLLEAVRIEEATVAPSDEAGDLAPVRAAAPALPVYALFLDLPLLTGQEVPHAPHLAVTAAPWPGNVAIYGSDQDAGYSLNRLIGARATVGVTESPLQPAAPALWDRGPPLRVRLAAGTFRSETPERVLNGANLIAVGDGSADRWELVQFAGAALVAPDVYDLSLRLRGQAGTEAFAAQGWPPGSVVVAMDGAPAQIGLRPDERGLPRHYRIGPARLNNADASYVHRVEAFDGIGLRPYAPAHLAATRRGGGDLEVRWIRRTRVGGDSWAGVDVPLGESGESYLLRVVKGGTVRREIAIAAPRWIYGAAQSAADGVAAPFEIHVAQISDQFGPGPFARIDVDV